MGKKQANKNVEKRRLLFPTVLLKILVICLGWLSDEGKDK